MSCSSHPCQGLPQVQRELWLSLARSERAGNANPCGRRVGSQYPELPGSPQVLPVKVTAGKVRVEDKQRLEQEQQSEEKRLAIMMMKKREKYLYKKIMFGKKRKIREVRRLGPSPTPWDGLFPNPLASSTPPCPW